MMAPRGARKADRAQQEPPDSVTQPQEARPAPAIETAVTVALEEYRNHEQEKQVYIQSTFTIQSLLILGTGALIPIIIQTQKWIILAILPFVQLGVLANSIYPMAMSLRHGMYLAVVEKRIERLIGNKSMRWEMRGVTNWPRPRLNRRTVEENFLSVATIVNFFALAVPIIIEIPFSMFWICNPRLSPFDDFSLHPEKIVCTASSIYGISVMAMGAIIGAAFAVVTRWAERVHAGMTREEWYDLYFVDFYDEYIDPSIIKVRSGKIPVMHIRNLSEEDQEFWIPSMDDWTPLKRDHSIPLELALQSSDYPFYITSPEAPGWKVIGNLRLHDVDRN